MSSRRKQQESKAHSAGIDASYTWELVNYPNWLIIVGSMLVGFWKECGLVGTTAVETWRQVYVSDVWPSWSPEDLCIFQGMQIQSCCYHITISQSAKPIWQTKKISKEILKRRYDRKKAYQRVLSEKKDFCSGWHCHTCKPRPFGALISSDMAHISFR